MRLENLFFYSANLDFEVKSEFEKYLWRFLEDDVRATEKITGLDLESKWKR